MILRFSMEYYVIVLLRCFSNLPIGTNGFSLTFLLNLELVVSVGKASSPRVSSRNRIHSNSAFVLSSGPDDPIYTDIFDLELLSLIIITQNKLLDIDQSVKV